MIEIDYSQLQTFIDCPRKYYNRYILGLHKKRYDERDLDKDFGHCVHRSLELLYKKRSLQEARDIWRTEYIGLEQEKAKTPANGERLVGEYWNYWASPMNMLSDACLETVSVEVVDSFIIDDAVKYLVKIDRVVKNSAGYWVMDHKTTRSLAYNYFWRFDPNMQVSGYCSYVEQKYGQCAGAIINVISIGYRERKWKDRAAGFYCEFTRDIVNRNKEQLVDFKKNVKLWTQKLVDAQESGVYCKNEGACHSYKGCAYRELCISCDDENVRDTLYEQTDTKAYLSDTGDSAKHAGV